MTLTTTSQSRRETYLIQDPYDDDAVQFIRTLFTYFGLRPVCFYTNKKARYYGERHFPILCTEMIEARYDVELEHLGAFAQEVGARYRVLGVIPYREDTLELAAELCGLLGLDWTPAETLRRFRNKFALKTHVAQRAPELRVPTCRLVRDAEDVWSEPLPARFVIKPNNGFGNRHIGVFDAEARSAVAAHLAKLPGATWILEEYIHGPEFHINGQVRSSGEVTLLGLMEYVRTAANGYQTVYQAERQCHTDHPLFPAIADYARRLMRATGLRRCPFHMELKVDARGPCMIDLGARFPSEGGGHTLSRLHPTRPDVYAVAAHDYLGDNSFGTAPVDWSHYDRHTTVLVYGISTEAGIIHRLDGLEEVEAMPEFVHWPLKPAVGDRLYRTTDLGSKPYLVELSHGGDAHDSERLFELVQRTIRINGSSSAPALLRAHARDVLRRVPPKLRWLAHRSGRILAPLRGRGVAPLSPVLAPLKPRNGR